MVRAGRLAIVTLVFASIVCGARSASADTSEMTAKPLVGDLEGILERQPEGPAFDCSLATLREVEKRICKNATLSRLDLELNDAYAGDAFGSFDALGVVGREASWLRERDRCLTNACLLRAYRERISAINEDVVAINRRMKREGAHSIPVVVPAALVARLSKIAGSECFRVEGRVDVGDGRPSLLAYTCGPCQPTDHFLVFHPEGPTYRVLIDEESCYVSGLFEGFQDERSHGFRRIETFTRDSACEHHEDFYDYDGRVYRLTASLDDKDIGPDCKHAQLTLYTRN
jgi:hypothetical protein